MVDIQIPPEFRCLIGIFLGSKYRSSGDGLEKPKDTSDWPNKKKHQGETAPNEPSGAESEVSNEKDLGWLGYIGDYTTQLRYIGIIMNHYKDPY